MLYREVIAVCSQIRMKHKNKLFVQNVEFWVLLVLPLKSLGFKGLRPRETKWGNMGGNSSILEY